jgi:hypothetical protein
MRIAATAAASLTGSDSVECDKLVGWAKREEPSSSRYPEPEVPVFVGHEVLVEAADTLAPIGPNECRHREDEAVVDHVSQYVTRRVEFGLVWPPASRLIGRKTLHRAVGDGELRISDEESDLPFNLRAGQDVIRIKELYERATCDSEGLVAGNTGSALARAQQTHTVSKAFCDETGRPICRAVIHHDDFHRLMRLDQCAVDCLLNRLTSVVRGHDDAYERVGWWLCALGDVL